MDVGLHYGKLWRHPAAYLISPVAHKHLHTGACSEREPHTRPLTWTWALEPFTHAETRNHSTKGRINLGYFSSILLAEVLNQAAHFCFTVPSKGDISCIKILNSNGKITAGKQVLKNYLPTRSDASRMLWVPHGNVTCHGLDLQRS